MTVMYFVSVEVPIRVSLYCNPVISTCICSEVGSLQMTKVFLKIRVLFVLLESN
jgi:hypothetical protein